MISTGVLVVFYEETNDFDRGFGGLVVFYEETNDFDRGFGGFL